MSRSPWGACARCGFKRRLTALRREWTGLKVCRDTCWDPKPAEHKPPRFKPEGVPVAGAAPETEPVFGRNHVVFIYNVYRDTPYALALDFTAPEYWGA